MKGGLEMKSSYGFPCQCVVLIALLLSATSACGQNSNSIDVATFVSMYKKAWDSPTLKNFRGTKCSAIGTVTEFGRQRVEHLTEFLDGEYWKQTSSMPAKPDNPDIITVRNPSYSFSVQQISEGKFLLNDLEHGVEYNRHTSIFSSAYGDRWVCRTLLDIFSDPKTKFHRIRETHFKEMPVFEVVVEYPIKYGDSSNPKGVGVMKPQRYFILRDSFLVVACCEGVENKPYTFFTHTLISYNDQYDSIEKVANVSVKDSGVSESVKRLITFDVTSFKKTKINEDECRLSFYGMPEPLGKASPSRLSFWLWIVCPLFLIVSLYLVRRTRKTAG